MWWLPRLLYSHHSRPEEIAQTRQVVLTAVQRLRNRLHSGMPLPADENELATALGGSMPRDAWGAPLNYQRFGSTNFNVTAMSPYPELMVISYDTRNTNAPLAIYSF
jgi:hypothetical protein